MEADLHIHTTASDGAFAPSEIVRMAALNKVMTVAITDHDTVGGIEEAIESAAKYNIDLIPGVELSAVYKSKDVHVLGYFIDYKLTWFNEFLAKIKNNRYERAQKIVKKLKSENIIISFDEVLSKSNNSSLGRPHIAKVLVEKGYANDILDAFNKYLVHGAIGYVEREKLSAAQAVTKITEAGGIAVLAHPGILELDDKNLNKLIEELKLNGLKGIEVYHPSHDINKTRNIYKLALKYRLVPTGGSDYHESGTRSGRAKAEIGNVGVTLETIETLKRIKFGAGTNYEVSYASNK